MKLVDTSVWVDHLRRGNAELISLLRARDVLMHPMIVGEITCGSLTQRSEVLGLLNALPSVIVARDSEALTLIERRHLYGRGVGWLDVHLLASALLTRWAFGLWIAPLSVATELGLDHA